jgi:hypothetical protein
MPYITALPRGVSLRRRFFFALIGCDTKRKRIDLIRFGMMPQRIQMTGNAI